jgi:hypothetical protein
VQAVFPQVLGNAQIEVSDSGYPVGVMFHGDVSSLHWLKLATTTS